MIKSAFSWGGIIALLSIVIISPISAQTATAVRNVDYPIFEVPLGNGWVTRTGEKTTGVCIEFQKRSDGYQEQFFSFNRVLDKEQFSKSLEISAAFRARTLLGSSVSAKARFAQQIDIRSESLSMALLGKVRKGAEFAAPSAITGDIRLTKDALGWLKTNPVLFNNVCGDSYVAVIYRGAEISAIMSFTSIYADQRTEISAQLKGSFLGFKAEGNFAQKVRQITDNQNVQISFHATGRPEKEPIPTDIDGMLRAVQTLPSNANYPYTMDLASYKALSNWPGGTISIKYAELENLVDQYQKFETLYFDLREIIQNSSYYIFGQQGITLDSIKILQDTLRVEHLPSLKKAINNCVNDSADSCKIPQKDKIRDYEFRMKLPVRVRSFDIDKQLSDLQALRAEIKEKISVTQNQDEKNRLSTLFDDYGKRMDGLFPQYTNAFANAVYTQWIQDANFARCSNNAISSDCLTNQELSSYRSRILNLLKTGR
jgi:hypothetical protein